MASSEAARPILTTRSVFMQEGVVLALNNSNFFNGGINPQNLHFMGLHGMRISKLNVETKKLKMERPIWVSHSSYKANP